MDKSETKHGRQKEDKFIGQMSPNPQAKSIPLMYFIFPAQYWPV